MTYRVYRYRWVVLAIYMYIAAISQLYWLNFAAIHTFMEEHLKMQASQLEWLTLIPLVIFILLTIPAGRIIDKKGLKYGLGIGVIFNGIFPILRLLLPDSFFWLFSMQLLIAIGSPFILNAVTKLAAVWFGPEEEALAIGLCSCALFAGIMLAFLLTGWLVKNLSYDFMLLIYGLLGLISVLAFIFLKSHPYSPSRPPQKKKQNASWGLKIILSNKNFIILSVVTLLNYGVFIALTTWDEKILHDFQRLDLISAGKVSGLFILSGIVGCIFIPLISDKMKRRKPLLILSLLIGALCISFFAYVNTFAINIINSLILGFFFLPALPVIYAMSADMVGTNLTGISLGYLQLIGNAAGILFGWLVEELNEIIGNFRIPLLLLGALLLIGCVLVFFCREKLPQTYK